VITATPDPWITVAELKTHANKTSAADDVELAGFVAAACTVITDRIGQVSPVAATADLPLSRHRRRLYGHGVAVLPDCPVVEVSAVVTLPGGEVVPAADALNNAHGWTLGPGGVLTVTGAMARRVRVTYTAGRDPLPGNIRLAALELAGHLWKASQLNNSSQRLPAGFGGDQVTMPGAAYALPIRVRELLGLGTNPTDHVLVG
jgi:hypothetical protein